MGGVNLSVESNVTVRCFNDKGRLTRTSYFHNKATNILVQGMLRYLKGDFTPTKYSLSAIYDSVGAVHYLPAELRLGYIGVQTEERWNEQMQLYIPYLVGVDSSLFRKPTFNERVLQKSFDYEDLLYPTKFESADITSFDDTNNSMALLLQTFIPSKTLVGYYSGSTERHVTPYPWAYWNQSLGKNKTGEWETMITELGLYSDNQLLARVLLDGSITVHEDGVITYDDPDYINNPIFQSESSSMVIEWRIGIISIGPNDTFITNANIDEPNN